MMPPDDDSKDVPSLSDADIAGIQTIVDSAPAVGVPSPGKGNPVGHILAKSVEVVSTPPDIWNGILEAVNNMTVPAQVAEQLQSHFNEVGFTIKNELLATQGDLKKIRHYTAAIRSDYKLALLHLPNWFLGMPETVGLLKHAVENISDHHGRIISVQLDRPDGGYTLALKSMSKRELSWGFVPWGLIKEVLDGKMLVTDAFDIPQRPQDSNNSSSPPLLLGVTLKSQDKQVIVDVFVKRATAKPELFDTVIEESDWSDDYRVEMKGCLSNDLKATAWKMLDMLLSWDRYCANGDSYLGRVLLKVLKTEGLTARRRIAKVMDDNRLVIDAVNVDQVKQYLKDQG
jgi:hypothetical protein